MAELGNLFGNAGVKDAKVEVEMLDYGYISECKDWTLLNTIVDVLKSGKEGHYPDVNLTKRSIIFFIDVCQSSYRGVFFHK